MKINKFILISYLLVILQEPIQAGPPFITDDPDTTPYKRGEFYVGSIGLKGKKEFFAFLPLVELDYGLIPDVQIHAIIPLAINKQTNPLSHTTHYGLGDIELGVKYRFIHETKNFPQVGIFPLLELPAGNPNDNLGNGKTQLFIPIWLQKSWGKWTSFGGGGYWFNPGVDNKNWVFIGLVVQKEIFKWSWLGVEGFYATAPKKDDPNSFTLNVGGGIGLQKNLHIIFSAGRNTGLKQFLYYVALYKNW